MKTIITIGRQFGSGGKEIGIRVAKELGIPFYDKELLQEAAKKSGLCEKIFENFDERPKSLLYSIAMDSYMFALPSSGVGDSLEQQVYLATFNTIRHIADQGPCVIIGRCADYALADYPNHLSLTDKTLKVPHMGWNSLQILKDDPLFRHVRDGEYVYYVHSFYARDCAAGTLAASRYGNVDVTGVVRRGNVYGTQFHPEKSGDTGLRLLRAFAEL